MASFITSHRPPWASEGGLPQGVNASGGLTGHLGVWPPRSLPPAAERRVHTCPPAEATIRAVRPECALQGLRGWCSFTCSVGPVNASRQVMSETHA